MPHTLQPITDGIETAWKAAQAAASALSTVSLADLENAMTRALAAFDAWLEQPTRPNHE